MTPTERQRNRHFNGARSGAPDPEPHPEPQDAAVRCRVDAEAVAARGPVAQALLDEIPSLLAIGAAAQPVVEVKLKAEPLIVVERQARLASQLT